MANSYLTRSISSTGTNTKGTFSGWIKRSELTNNYPRFFAINTDANNYLRLFFHNDDKLHLYIDSGSGIGQRKTTRLFRDTNAWYHIVVAIDSTLATAGDRIKVWVNGVQETAFDSTINPSQNADMKINNSGSTIVVGKHESASSDYFSGYMSHVAWVDGAALAPTVFGETDSTSGIWKFKSPSTTWGTNGVHLKFENSGNLGLDSSGQGNNFTTNGDLKQALDTPSNVYATLNPIHLSGTQNLTNLAFSNGNNTVTSTQGGSPYPFAFSTLGASSGKYYAEFKTPTSNSSTMGISTGVGAGGYLGGGSNEYAYYYDGRLYNNGSGVSTGFDAWSDNDILGVAMDLDNNKIYFHKNGTYQNSGNPTAGTGGNSITAPSLNGTGVYHFACGDAGGGTPSVQANFGNGYFGTTAITSAGSNGNGSLFEYDVPTGFYALNTKNINTYG